MLAAERLDRILEGQRARSARRAITVVSVVLLGLLVAACSSKAIQAKSTPPGSPSTTTAAAGFTCPPDSVVNADLDMHITGPPTIIVPPTGGQICDYGGPGQGGQTRVTIEPGTEAELKGNEGAVGGGNTIVPIAHLGNDAFLVQGSGTVFVFKGKTLIAVSSFSNTDAQVESLARQIIGS
jgi:hypothetical protein